MNDAVRRSHKIVELLAGRFFDGLPNKELADAVRTSAANISRDMAILEQLGYARKLENGLWGLTTKPLAIMRSYENHFNKLQSRIEETERNISSAATRYGG
jgi:DNA-binding IclR family transcriptional regulator